MLGVYEILKTDFFFFPAQERVLHEEFKRLTTEARGLGSFLFQVCWSRMHKTGAQTVFNGITWVLERGLRLSPTLRG